MNTTTPKCRYAKFLSQFEFGAEDVDRASGNDFVRARWHGNVGYVDLGSKAGIIARIELSDRGYQGKFDKFDVQVIHRVNGKLDAITFHFQDYFKKEDRADDRVKDQPDQAFYAWSGSSNKSSIDWYIARPKSVHAIVRAINEYLSMWQTTNL